MPKPTCSVDGCEQPRRKRSWCASHYSQQRQSGNPPEPFKYKWGQPEARPFIPKPNHKRAVCTVVGCAMGAHGGGLCVKHYTRQLRYGDVEFVQRARSELQPCVVCGSDEKSIKSRRFCSPKCEALFSRHEGNVPDVANCGKCGAAIYLSSAANNGRRRHSNIKLCDECRPWHPSIPGVPSVAELVNRDGPNCSICGDPVDMTLRARVDGYMGPSIDHILPRSLGGSDEPENLALAHLSCNMQKSNRVA